MSATSYEEGSVTEGSSAGRGACLTGTRPGKTATPVSVCSGDRRRGGPRAGCQPSTEADTVTGSGVASAMVRRYESMARSKSRVESISL